MSNNVTITKAQLRGLRIGTFFGLVWFIVGATAIHTRLLIPVIIVGVILFVSIVRRLINLRHTAHSNGETNLSLRNKQFRLVIVTEIAGVAFAILISKATAKPELTTPLIMLIVGLHFFWMAQLFKVVRYTLLAVIMSLVAIVLIILAVFNATEMQTLQAIAGLVSAGLLWISVLSTFYSTQSQPLPQA